MQLALSQAEAAAEAGEVPVGAVLLDQAGELVASGYNQPVSQHDCSAHAEIVCLRRAGERLGNYRLPETTLYVTLEPCVMCAGAIIQARVARVVFGATDPKAGAAGSVYDVLSAPRLNHSVALRSGVMADQCGAILQQFFRARRKSWQGRV